MPLVLYTWISFADFFWLQNGSLSQAEGGQQSSNHDQSVCILVIRVLSFHENLLQDFIRRRNLVSGDEVEKGWLSQPLTITLYCNWLCTTFRFEHLMYLYLICTDESITVWKNLLLSA